MSNEFLCPRCNKNPASGMVTHVDGETALCICNDCSTEVFGIKDVDYDGTETESVCELAWGCRENCSECTCVDVK